MSDWKEVEDLDKGCSESNGWCGWCGNCREHSEDLHRQEDWEHQEERDPDRWLK